jgi:hypothetical protein
MNSLPVFMPAFIHTSRDSSSSANGDAAAADSAAGSSHHHRHRHRHSANELHPGLDEVHTSQAVSDWLNKSGWGAAIMFADVVLSFATIITLIVSDHSDGS